MVAIAEMLNDAELLVRHALVHHITLPPQVADVLMAGQANAAAIEAPGQARQDFLAAFAAATAAIGRSAHDLRAGAARRDRIRQQAAGAQVLLSFAAANGKKVEDGIRNPLVAIQTAVDDGSLTVAQEQEFLKAYEGLTVALAPITVETLQASRTVLPGWGNWWKFERWSFGRFFNVILFVFILIGTCISLSYYFQGASALSRFKELEALLVKNDQELRAKTEIARSRAETLTLEEKKPNPDQGALTAARKAMSEADADVQKLEAEKISAREEVTAIPGRLQQWALEPCESRNNFVFRLLLCSKIYQSPIGQHEDQNRLMKVEAGRTVASRLNDVYLPLMLGWLGAHAFILRRMSKDITERSFAPGSTFNHIVRVGLGALAGLASNWLLTSQAVGGAQWANMPVWALAFVAGYGIELVFAFMDRIIGAFTNKQ